MSLFANWKQYKKASNKQEKFFFDMPAVKIDVSDAQENYAIAGKQEYIEIILTKIYSHIKNILTKLYSYAIINTI